MTHATLLCGECRCDRVGVSYPDLLADPKQKPAILYSEERHLCTMNIRNIYNLFTFPSYFRRWRLSSVLSSFELRSLFGHHCSECGKRVCLFVCLFVCLDWVLCGLPIPIHTFTHTPSSSPTLLPPTGCDDHHLRRPTATLLLSPIQNMCGISSLAFTTVAHRDFLYLQTADIYFGPSPPSLVFAIPQ